MIYVKAVAVCDSAGCETTAEYLVEVSAFKIDLNADYSDGPVSVDTLPDDWVWLNDFRGASKALCPHCVKEKTG